MTARHLCADCRLIDRLPADPDDWTGWQRWRVRALVEVLAAKHPKAAGLIETDRDRAVIVAGYRQRHCGGRGEIQSAA